MPRPPCTDLAPLFVYLATATGAKLEHISRPAISMRLEWALEGWNLTFGMGTGRVEFDVWNGHWALCRWKSDAWNGIRKGAIWDSDGRVED